MRALVGMGAREMHDDPSERDTAWVVPAGHTVFGDRTYLESTEYTGEYTGSHARPDKLVLASHVEIAAPLRRRS
jgi:hypothetical protein